MSKFCQCPDASPRRTCQTFALFAAEAGAPRLLLWRGLGAASAPASGRIALNGRRLQKLLEELFEDSLEARDAA